MLFLVVLVDVLGLTIVLPLLAIYSESFGASAQVPSLLMPTYAACQLVAGRILGRLSDRYGRRRILLISQLGTLAGFVLLAQATSLWMVFAGRVIDGLTAGNLTVAQAYIADHTPPDRRARSFALIGIAFGVGFLFGPLISAGLSYWHGYAAPFWAAAAMSGTSILGTIFLLPPDRPASELPAGAIALNSTSMNGSRVIGPAIGGVLYHLVGVSWVFCLNGLTYIAVIVVLVRVTLPAVVTPDRLLTRRRAEHAPTRVVCGRGDAVRRIEAFGIVTAPDHFVVVAPPIRKSREGTQRRGDHLVARARHRERRGDDAVVLVMAVDQADAALLPYAVGAADDVVDDVRIDRIRAVARASEVPAMLGRNGTMLVGVSAGGFRPPRGRGARGRVRRRRRCGDDRPQRGLHAPADDRPPAAMGRYGHPEPAAVRRPPPRLRGPGLDANGAEAYEGSLWIT